MTWPQALLLSGLTVAALASLAVFVLTLVEAARHEHRPRRFERETGNERKGPPPVA